MEWELDVPGLERLLNCLASCSLEEFASQYTAITATQGYMSLTSSGRRVRHNNMHQRRERYLLDEEWALFYVNERKSKLTDAVEQKDTSSKPTPHAQYYAVYNAGREGWCILSTNFYRLPQHVFEEDHKETCCNLVPRVRPTVNRTWWRPLFQPPLRGTGNPGFLTVFYFNEKIKEVAPNKLILYYITHFDSDTGASMVAGFDLRTKKHIAHMRYNWTHPYKEVQMDEAEEK